MSLWYCCKCSFGPHDSALYVACIDCSARRCRLCPEEKANYAVEAHSHSHSSSCGPSPYPAVVDFNTSRRMSLDTKPVLPTPPSLPQVLSLRPSLPASKPRLSLGDFQVKTYETTYMYICCKCHDGPKVYNIQPKCVSCDHAACSNCTQVK
ncbi:hypothetical protein N7488_001894 [Penicillium malachiteum]|nr:hypothetical protein N7488_001894 [Penicillium malachiteum]